MNKRSEAYKMRDVIHSAEYVVQKSHHVRIDKHALEQFCKALFNDGIDIPPWDATHHFNDQGEKSVAYFLVLDSMNFCFWPFAGNKRWEIQHNYETVSGYYALALSLKRAIEKGIPIDDAAFLKEMSFDDLLILLKGRGSLQLMEERLQILNELGEILLREYEGKAAWLIESAGNSVVKLVSILSEKIPSFRDWAEYQGRTVYFFKRAQILAADLYGAFGGKSWGFFHDMEKLTAFADYKLPQVLRHLGILEYSEHLAGKIDKKILLAPGCPEEVEIRAHTIYAVEQIRQDLARDGKRVYSHEIDWLLWNLGQRDSFRIKPYHLTAGTCY